MIAMPGDLSVQTALLAACIGYLCGSIPFGLVLARAFGFGDIRKIGSGNIGATNALRTGNKPLAALTLAGDILKGTVPVLVCWRWGVEAACTAGLFAFLGHLFPVWLGFKGGKGVATYIGILLGLAPLGVAIFVAVWLGMALLFRYSSLAALTATLVVPVALWLLGYDIIAGLAALLTVLVYLKHHANIRRLASGTEAKIGSKG
ncbi:glycerol-3-phosphate acyltransferase PlsY [Aureimonas altamirensis DSM 21988]|uniref:Glycerol-3-phosphate acyltransferase n=2 Tax=Aureimonas altamirensis TaxID=370622 RepID=A0A0P0YXY8_9HYPH|nr:glycerol-3-phosphate 1-O-acyltransferase PlsY [Aureimonas altamirensis]BAT26388.1 glycerol-3-phosphate acyltransferase PlsY [Aureimonas altamirensis]SHJ46198.1 glycerol-3-phosphate acyltransferase PlsY [Aureimonas altamirensis DSM 21988]